MYTKLTAITTQYSKFTKNQVLTEGQLNQFLEYFEDQDHLSRIGLSGVGIVCGFKVALSKTLNNAITITKGFGTTTDGDLITLVEPRNGALRLIDSASKTYTHYRTFVDSNAKYPHFHNEDSQIDLIEVFPEEDIDTSNTTYTRLSQEQLKNKVVLLYLENYPKQGDLCTTLDCDNQGQLHVSKLRVLLVSVEDAASIAARDVLYSKHDWNSLYKSLPELKARRDILSPKNTTDYQKLKNTYYKLIHTATAKRMPRLQGFEPKTREFNFMNELKSGLNAIFSKFGRGAVSSKISKVFDLSLSSIPPDFQYLYDVLKDLVDSYNEVKALLLHINVECSPDIGSFPKHLMLGKLEKDLHPQDTAFRHRFYKSPIIGIEDTNLKKVYSLLNRIEQILNNYLGTEKSGDIKITPSILEGELGHQAIPFYYDVTEQFLDNWSFEKYQNLRQTSNLSYHAENYSNADAVREPLYYNLDNYNFLRIEGVQGKSYKEALNDVIDLKEKFGLNFDVKVLPLGKPNQRINMADYQCEFEDLEVLLEAWTTEQECILASITKFFSGFKLDLKSKDSDNQEGGKIYYLDNVTEEVYTTPKEIFYSKIREKSKPYASAFVKKDEEKKPKEHDLIAKMHSLEEAPMVRLYENYKPIHKDVVKENLVKDENTLGFFVDQAIQQNEGGCESVNDILSNAKANVKAQLETEAWEANPEVKNFILNDATNLLVNAHMLSHSIPVSVKEIDRNTIQTYKRTLDDICSLVKNLRVKFRKARLSETQNNIVLLLLNQLAIVCCSGKKLDILQKEIEKRKEEILKRLQLSEFVKQHPGLRHYAGVPVGGTFVMAYLKDDEEEKSTYETVDLEVEFLRQPTKTLRENEFNGGVISLWNDKVSMPFAFVNKITRDSKDVNQAVLVGRSINDTVKNLAQFLNFRWRLAGYSNSCKAYARDRILRIELIDQRVSKEQYYIQFFNQAIIGTTSRLFFEPNRIISRNITSKNTVIADFALPYLCCSDCTPVNFIVPKEPVSLSLPAPYVCLNEATEPLPFTVKPADGEVTADVKEGLSAGVVQDENGAYWFDAKQVNPGLIGRPIRFLVNNEKTTAVVTVYETPQAVITASPDNFMYNDMRTEVRVAFEVSGSGLTSNTEFEWDFGDDSDSSKDKPDSKGVVWHTYKLPVNETNTVSPKVKVSNGSCAQDIDMDEIQFDEPVDVTLEIQDTYCYDIGLEQQEIRVPFTNVNPAGGKIAIAGGSPSALLSIDQTKKELVISNPWDYNDFGTAISFTLDGQATDAQITIYRTPSIFISSKSGEPYWVNGVLMQDYQFDAVSSDGSTLNAFTFKWHIDDNPVSDKASFEHTFETDNQEGQSFVVKLSATSEEGCGKESEITVTIEPQDVQTCSDMVKAAILDDNNTINEQNVSNLDGNPLKIHNETRSAYAAVTKSPTVLNAFVTGSNNNALKGLLVKLIINTAQSILKAEAQDQNELVAFYTRYLRLQFRLFFHVIKCQEDMPDADVEKYINPVLKAMLDALENLSNVAFDVATPDPASDDGTLRQFLSECLQNTNFSDFIKNRIQQMINVILVP